MNNLGFSKDSVNIGDFRIKGEGETLIIGNENGGDGYILPTEKGTEGQVLTMNADNSTSFQDAVGGGDNVLGVGNGADITIPYAPSSAPVVNVIPPSFIGTRRVNISNIPVGGSVHFYVNSRYNLQIPSAGSTDTYTNILFFVTGFRADNTSVGACVPTIRNNNYFSGAISVPADLVGYLKVEGVITRTATDTFKATVTAFNRRYADTLNPCQIWENVSSIEEINFPAPQDDDYIQWQLQFFNSYYSTGTFVLTNPSVYWTLKNVSTAITPPVSTSDHTQLTNLNLGDAGHTQFALLQGRSGGQVLSGGITPANFLTLKSHTAGLNNIVIKDLNTTFEKNLQIGTNKILDTLNNSIDFLGGDMNLLNTSFTNRIVVASQNNIDILGNNQIKLGVPNASSNVVITSTDTSINQDLNMNNNDIINVTRIEGNTGQDMVLYSDDGITIAARDPMIINALDGDGIICQTSSNTRMVVTSTELDVRVPINMNDNIISNTPTVSSSSSLQLKGSSLDEITINPNASTGVSVFSDIGKGINLVADGGNQIMTLDGTFVTFFQGGGSFVPTFTASAFDMNNGGINNVSSINGLTPVGGLSSSTSNSAILTASTAEQSILGLTFVGGRMASANSFKQGDAYTATLAGNFSSNNGDTLTLRLKGGATGTTVLSSIVVPLNGSTNKYFELEINFVIRQIGVATTADLAINYDFSYNQNSGGNFQGERLCESNNTNFDTTIDNQLDITAQFSSTSANNSIETILATLGKNY